MHGLGALLTRNRLNKAHELAAFRYVFGTPSHEVIPHERPDILDKASNGSVLGVEVTELFTNLTAAKLQHLKGYALDLLDRKRAIHRRDQSNIKVDEVVIQDSAGKEKAKVMAIIHEMPPFKERASLLWSTISAKEAKASDYLSSCT